MDTNLFATKEYVDAQIGGVAGVTLSLSVPGISNSTSNYHTHTLTMDTGFNIGYVLLSWNNITTRAAYYKKGECVREYYPTLVGQQDTKVYINQNTSVSATSSATYCSITSTMTITLNNDNTISIATNFITSGMDPLDTFSRDAFDLAVVAYK